MLLYVVLSTEYKVLLSKYNACVHNVPFFSATSTWCHKVHSKYEGKCLLLHYYFAKDIAFFILGYTVCVYHDYHEILYHDISSITIIMASLIISIIIDACQSCTPKQIVLQTFLLLQLLYCVSVLLLTSGCKWTASQYKHHYYLVPPQSVLTKQI